MDSRKAYEVDERLKREFLPHDYSQFEKSFKHFDKNSNGQIDQAEVLKGKINYF